MARRSIFETRRPIGEPRRLRYIVRGAKCVSHRLVGLTWAVTSAVACGSNENVGTGLAQSAIVYDHDGRHEPYEERDATIYELALRSSVALVPTEKLRSVHGQIDITAESAASTLGLCASERFADQPCAADCSGVLVEPDLVLTAAHCVRGDGCARIEVVRGYAYEARGQEFAIATGDVARCAKVLAASTPALLSGPDFDYAWLRLDHPIGSTSLPVATVRESRLQVGDSLILIGNGAGLPTKIDEGGMVVDPRDDADDYFIAALDNFQGGSGSGVFDDAGQLLGIAVRGGADFDVTEAGCQQRRQVDASSGMEEVSDVRGALAGLCSSSEADPVICPDSHAYPPVTCDAASMRPASRGAWDLLLTVLAFAGVWRRARSRRAGP